MENDRKLSEKIQGALTGVAFGDSFGMPVEMWSRQRIAAEYGEIREHLPGNGKNLVSKGFRAFEITDDTISTMLVIEMLSSSGGLVDPGKFMELLKKWAESSPKSSMVIGPSTAKAMEKIAAGVPMEETGLTGTTNGAAMKIIPIGLLHDPQHLDEMVSDVRLLCLPTHNTSSAISGASAAAAAACYGVNGGIDMDEMVTVAGIAAEKGLAWGNQIGAPSVRARLEFGVQYFKCHSVKESIEFVADIIGTGLPVEESVVAAISFAYLARADPLLCAEYAVQAGGDTDTIAAVACGICGAFCGKNGFDAGIVRKLEDVNGLSFEALTDQMMTARRKRRQER